MWYATLEIGKIKMLNTIEAAQAATASQPAASDRFLAYLGKLLVAIGQRLQTRHQYGTVLHAG
ncbi:MAG: hypothetical protein H8D34_34405 [Chloroflexi bacterium]|nr:hypothetical protein [Chloroflexota bacterium]MBL7164387.1 hypothetical protein [Anaerolineales bacterium]